MNSKELKKEMTRYPNCKGSLTKKDNKKIDSINFFIKKDFKHRKTKFLILI